MFISEVAYWSTPPDIERWPLKDLEASLCACIDLYITAYLLFHPEVGTSIWRRPDTLVLLLSQFWGPIYRDQRGSILSNQRIMDLVLILNLH